VLILDKLSSTAVLSCQTNYLVSFANAFCHYAKYSILDINSATFSAEVFCPNLKMSYLALALLAVELAYSIEALQIDIVQGQVPSELHQSAQSLPQKLLSQSIKFERDE
jgi:hypothetical protein